MAYVGSRVFVILMLAASMGANFVEVRLPGIQKQCFRSRL
jgi:hypothetical protein